MVEGASCTAQEAGGLAVGRELRAAGEWTRVAGSLTDRGQGVVHSV